MKTRPPQGKVDWTSVFILVAVIVAIAVVWVLVSTAFQNAVFSVADLMGQKWGIGGLVAFCVLCFATYGVIKWQERKRKGV
jgi:hypothetical protein